jgi:hypothetical protein
VQEIFPVEHIVSVRIQMEQPQPAPVRPTLASGQINGADRIQRLTIGTALMLLTVLGLVERIDWRAMIALTLQSELLLTGLIGWCPIYWTCSVANAKRN